VILGELSREVKFSETIPVFVCLRSTLQGQRGVMSTLGPEMGRKLWRVDLLSTWFCRGECILGRVWAEDPHSLTTAHNVACYLKMRLAAFPQSSKVSLKMKPNALINGISILGFLAFFLFGILALYFIFHKPALEPDLVTVSAIVIGAENESGHKRDVDLVVTLRDEEVKLRSCSPYPSKFMFGADTSEKIMDGDRVNFILERSELEAAPRKNHRRGYLWREFVGMSTASAVHLTPQDHIQWHLNNQKIGKFFFPVLCLGGVYLIGSGYRMKKAGRMVSES